ncbi:hypothetical protein [Saccharibacillus qingshengii]|nr:hypothetical protein [Saccharibacillus qingshengii]
MQEEAKSGLQAELRGISGIESNSGDVDRPVICKGSADYMGLAPFE